MKEIVIVCSLGISTTFTVNDMMKSVKSKNLSINITALALEELYEVIESRPVDLVLITPPIASKFTEIKENIAERVPVVMISAEHYVKYNGEAILNEALEHLK